MVKRRSRHVVGIVLATLLLGVSITTSSALASKSSHARDAAAAKAKPKPKSAAEVQQNLADLYAAAKAEGTVIWQVGGVPSTYQALANAFSQKYPGINVQIVNIQGTDVPGRIITEGQKPSFDVTTNDPVNLEQAIARKLIAAPFWANYGVAQSRIRLGGRLLDAYDFSLGWFYNTQKLNQSQLPKTWNDLLSPQWKGQALINSQGAEGYEGMFMSKQWNLKQFNAYVSKFKQQGWPATAAGATIINAVASGQDEIGVSAIVQLPTFVNQGAPLAILPLGPIVARPQGPAVLKYAQHPNAARLLSAWLVSDDAEAIWKSALGLGPAQPCAADQLAQMICDAHASVTYIEKPSQAVNYNALEALNRKALGF